MDTFLGMALTDPATGLPNFPYFRLIHSWEEKKAERRSTHVCAVHIQILSGNDLLRRVLMLRLCQEMRASDLMASEGRSDLWVLLTSPDAEHVETIAQRIHAIVDEANASADGIAAMPAGDHLAIRTDVRNAMGDEYWSMVR